MNYNTRVAPSPTGMFHIGTARTAYFNWLVARASGGKFILRIDDTDVTRNDPAYDKVILDSMDWLGLDYDALYRQSDRLDRYRDVASGLLGVGLATKLENGAVALSIPKTNHKIFDFFYETTSKPIKLSDDSYKIACNTVLMRGDGLPTYHFATVIDDIDMDVNWVIRGADHLANTPRHLMISWALQAGCENMFNNVVFPIHTHVGLIMLDGKKMSKRDETAPLKYYIDAGYDRDAILNFILRLGWAPKVDDKTTAVLTRDDALRLFLDYGSMKANPAAFDLEKLKSFDRKYKGRAEQISR